MHLHTKNGDAFTGIFAGASLEGQDPSYLLKMVRPTSKSVSNGPSHDESEYVGVGPDHAMTFGTSEVTSMLANNVPEVTTTLSQNGTSTDECRCPSLCLRSRLGAATGFRTDSDIAGNLAVRERHLQRWVPPTQGGVDMSLESAGDWDQFVTNEQQFGVKSDYDENLYTTRIDRSNPLYPMRLAEADRIAKEIEADSSHNVHVREERGQGEDDGADEEERLVGRLYRRMPMLTREKGTAVSVAMALSIPLYNRAIRTATCLPLVDRPIRKMLLLAPRLILPSSRLRLPVQAPKRKKRQLL